MTDSSSERDPVERLADEFGLRCRQGESPSISEYVVAYPQHAGRIEQLFPAVAMMERLRIEERAQREIAVRRAESVGPSGHVGDFDIIQEIGRGGMGIVYEAEQKSLARRVAVKVLPRHALLADKHVKRFQREAQTAANLHHTNIVPVFGVGEQDGLHYYVMPLVRGVGLDEIVRELRRGGNIPIPGPTRRAAPSSAARDVNGIAQALIRRKLGGTGSDARESPPGTGGNSFVPADTSDSRRCSTQTRLGSNETSGKNGKQKNGRRPGRDRSGRHTAYWPAVARIGVQAAEALDHAHAQGTLHRDIKPSNLLVDANGVVCVSDFGLARAVDHPDGSRSSDVVGTLRYMAPEQFRGAADPRTDIYALGLTLYELLTLRPASEDADRRRCLRGQQAFREPIRPRKVNQTIPRDLETVILKCLADEPSRRYQTAAALAADLQRFLEDRPIHARRASWVERAWRWCRRSPALAAMSALAALLLVAMAATALAGYLHTRKAYTEASGALRRAEATSQLSLEVLENIYLKLSPDRLWISSDSDAGGEACACIGLRSGDTSASAAQRTALPVQASREIASLLENLLVFYDRLAEQVSNDSQVMLQSAIASRRVGNIRQRLGQVDQAEREYVRAVEKLTRLRTGPDPDAGICTELARSHNEIGNVRSARLAFGRAYESHRKALVVLRSFEPTDRLPERYRYELARTLYFLTSKRPNATGSPSGEEPVEATTARRPDEPKSNEYRQAAIRILERLARENPDSPQYRFLLALCHRPSGFAAPSAWRPAATRGRERAIRILEQLKSQFPGVADYRYELTATYAWFPVGLFPWQGRFAVGPAAEENLLKALDESHWLVAHRPAVAHYACGRALILAKLGMVRWATGRLKPAEEFFQEALETQATAVAKFPGLPSHNRVLLEFLRLRLGQVCYERSSRGGDLEAAGKSRRLLETCLENLRKLTTRPELAKDRLAQSSLAVARAGLSRVLAQSGRDEEYEAAAPGPP